MVVTRHLSQFPLSHDALLRLIELDQRNINPPWSINSWENINNAPKNSLLFILKDNEKIIGFSLYDFFDNTAHLLKITIDPLYRSQGNAKSLLSEDFRYLKHSGATSVYLEVAVDNQDAIKLYEALGFELLVRKQKFYSGGRDANAMSLRLE